MPAAIYYVPCQEPGCWVLFKTKEQVPFDPICRLHGCQLIVTEVMKGFVTDKKFWGGYEDNWLRLKSHYLDGPAFGGLVGTARGFGRFLQDQLRTESVLLGAEAKRLLETKQTDRAGEPIPMTLGWHVGEAERGIYFFKEGGGGGFHGEMRLYPDKGMASVVMVNCTVFNSNRFLNRVDRAYLERL